MALTPLGSALYGALFPAAEARRLFADEAEIAAIIRFEQALARAQARLGIIPADAGEALAEALGGIDVSPADLAAGVGSSGMAVPGLVAALREKLPPELASWLHWGATSQDALDTALVLRLKPLLTVIEAGIDRARHRLAALADAHRDTPMVARTRWQQASPTSFGLKAAYWLDPLNRLSARLSELRPRLLAVQCGGAAGNLAQVGPEGPQLIAALAAELELHPAPPWHGARDRLEELGGWLAGLTGALGKMGTDLVLMAQSEVAEVRLAATGGSSTLPQKQNPVGPEMLIALARFNASSVSALHQAALHAHERDGAAWTSEWLVLPQMAAAAESAVAIAGSVLDGLAPNVGRMRANLDASRGLILAEAASFALSRHMPRAEAQALVKRAVAEATAEGRELIDVLAAATDAPVDWDRVRDPDSQFGAADGLVAMITGRLADAGGAG